MRFFNWFQSAPEMGPPELKNPETGPEKDDWQLEIGPGALDPDDDSQDNVPESIAGICVAIEYLDASGGTSSRRIICRSVFEAHEMIYLHGHCLLRGENRMFRLDRVQKLRLPADWVRFPDPSAFFRGYLRASSENRRNKWDSFLDGSERYARLSQTRRIANHGFRVLTFVGRADGGAVNQERKIIQDFVCAAGKLAQADLKEDDCSEIALDTDRLFPTKKQVAHSLDVIVRDNDQSELLLKSLNALVAADGLRSRRQANAVTMLVELLQNRKTTSAQMAS
jgi:hypothetical protein